MNEINFSCPHCSQHIKTTRDLGGLTVNCPTCKKQINIPQEKRNEATPTVISGKSSRSSLWLGAFGAVAALFAVLFFTLWLLEKSDKSRIIEKPVQVIREVPVEKIKTVEVPTKLTAMQEYHLELGRNFAAPRVVYTDDVLCDIKALAVTVELNQALKSVVTEERIKNKFELALRRSGILIDEKASPFLGLYIHGVWDESKSFCTKAIVLRLCDVAYIKRGSNNELIMTGVTSWDKVAVGFAGKVVLENSIIKEVEEFAELFANKYLAAQQRAKSSSR